MILELPCTRPYGTGIWHCDMPKKAQKQHHKKVAGKQRNKNWQGSRCNDVEAVTQVFGTYDMEAVNQVFGANEVEIKWKSLEALRLLRQADQALEGIHKFLADCTDLCEFKGPLILQAVREGYWKCPVVN